MWIRRPGGGNRRPLLKKDIEEAQRNSLSAAGAARILGVSYATYKKYARSYDIHEQHVNQGGKGIPKPNAQGKRFALSDILEGKHPTYNVKSLQQRLIKGGYMDEQCTLCSFEERRITDFKIPLMLIFKDGDRTNHLLENIYLLCYNCAFLTVGELNKLNPYRIRQLAKLQNNELALKGNDDMLGVDSAGMAEWVEEAKAEMHDD